MTWLQPAEATIVAITEREHQEPMRTFLHQLRRTGYEVFVLQRVNYASVNRVPPPQVVLADATSQYFRTTNNTSTSMQATWEYVPVIVVASANEVTRISFSAHLHDFISLPTTLPELEARIRFALWKTQGQSAPRDQIEVSGLRMNMSTYEVWVNNRHIDLTYKEFELLKFLVGHPRRVYSRTELLEMVWESEYYGGSRTVDVHILRLRAKLGPTVGKMIHTVRNVGYRFG